jgi:hypothetical protein
MTANVVTTASVVMTANVTMTANVVMIASATTTASVVINLVLVNGSHALRVLQSMSLKWIKYR